MRRQRSSPLPSPPHSSSSSPEAEGRMCPNACSCCCSAASSTLSSMLRLASGSWAGLSRSGHSTSDTASRKEACRSSLAKS